MARIAQCSVREEGCFLRFPKMPPSRTWMRRGWPRLGSMKCLGRQAAHVGDSAISFLADSTFREMTVGPAWV